MNRRKLAYQIIVADVAQRGIAGKPAIRAYIETRLSYQSFREAIRLGLQIYARQKKNAPAVVLGDVVDYPDA